MVDKIDKYTPAPSKLSSKVLKIEPKTYKTSLVTKGEDFDVYIIEPCELKCTCEATKCGSSVHSDSCDIKGE